MFHVCVLVALLELVQHVKHVVVSAVVTHTQHKVRRGVLQWLVSGRRFSGRCEREVQDLDFVIEPVCACVCGCVCVWVRAPLRSLKSDHFVPPQTIEIQYISMN